MDRNLDGVYFRIKRNGKFNNICFSDLTDDEKQEVMKDRDVKWLKSLCAILANTIKDIGDQFDICGGVGEDE